MKIELETDKKAIKIILFWFFVYQKRVLHLVSVESEAKKARLIYRFIDVKGFQGATKAVILMALSAPFFMVKPMRSVTSDGFPKYQSGTVENYLN